MSFVRELKRRNVFRVGGAYLIIAWLLLQVSDTLVPALHLPDWFQSGVALLLILGFPLALFFAWAFELTPDGLKKERNIEAGESIGPVTGRKLDFAIIGLLTVALGYFAFDKFVPSPGKSQDSIISIAVLAFDNMSDDPGNESFSDGISEEILNLLAKVPELRVTSRSSAFSFKGQNLDIPTMATKLNVKHVLEGSVRKFGSQIRIKVQLIEAVTDTQLWSETYNKEFKNVFAIQDEIAAAVVDKLKITLLGEKPKSRETTPETYALYLQAVFFQNQGTLASNQQAETLLTQALKIDPNYAPAWAQLSLVFSSQAWGFAVRPDDEAEELARNAIRTALELDPQYGRAYATLGDIELHFAWNFTAASELMQRALALNPGDTYILGEAAHLECILGRIDECINLYRQIVTLDPLSPAGHIDLGRAYYFANRLEEAADSIQLGLSLNSSQRIAHYLLALVLLAQGDAPAALVAIEQETVDWRRLHGMVIVQHALGNAGASNAALQMWMECCVTDRRFQAATIYAFQGEINKAFNWLDRAYEVRNTLLPYTLVSPAFATLHDDPRWEPLLDKIGLPR